MENQIPNQDQIEKVIHNDQSDNQFGVALIPYHTHNGTDSPHVSQTGQKNIMVYGTTSIIINPQTASLFTITTSSVAATATITTSSPGMAGKEIKILITNDGGSGRTIAFGNYFKSKGSFTGTAGSSAILTFISDGSWFWEMCRTTGL